jgi:hypothetical protein
VHVRCCFSLLEDDENFSRQMIKRWRAADAPALPLTLIQTAKYAAAGEPVMVKGKGMFAQTSIKSQRLAHLHMHTCTLITRVKLELQASTLCGVRVAV